MCPHGFFNFEDSFRTATGIFFKTNGGKAFQMRMFSLKGSCSKYLSSYCGFGDKVRPILREQKT